MNKLFFIITLFSPIASSAAMTLMQKIHYLNYVNEHVPQLFNPLMAYDVDLLRVLDQQIALEENAPPRRVYHRIEMQDLVLEELPPRVAVFRGFLGYDRSTRDFAMYVNSAYERVYKLSLEGVVLGYVAASIVSVGDLPTVYVHTIAGARVSPDLVEPVLQGVTQAVSAEGVRQTAIPTKQTYAILNQFTGVQQGLEPLVLHSTPQLLTYLDKEFREGLNSPQNYWDYNLPRANQLAVIYQPIRALPTPLITPSRIPPYDPTGQLDRAQLVLIAAGLSDRQEQTELVAGIGEAIGLSRDKLKAFKEVIANESCRPTIEYVARVQDFMSQFDGSISLTDMQREYYLFGLGFLRATDAFDKRYVEANLNALFLKPEKSKAGMALQALKRKHRDVLEASTMVRTRLVDLLQPHRFAPERLSVAHSFLDAGVGARAVFESLIRDVRNQICHQTEPFWKVEWGLNILTLKSVNVPQEFVFKNLHQHRREIGELLQLVAQRLTEPHQYVEGPNPPEDPRREWLRLYESFFNRLRTGVVSPQKFRLRLAAEYRAFLFDASRSDRERVYWGYQAILEDPTDLRAPHVLKALMIQQGHGSALGGLEKRAYRALYEISTSQDEFADFTELQNRLGNYTAQIPPSSLPTGERLAYELRKILAQTSRDKLLFLHLYTRVAYHPQAKLPDADLKEIAMNLTERLRDAPNADRASIYLARIAILLKITEPALLQELGRLFFTKTFFRTNPVEAFSIAHHVLALAPQFSGDVATCVAALAPRVKKNFAFSIEQRARFQIKLKDVMKRYPVLRPALQEALSLARIAGLPQCDDVF